MFLFFEVKIGLLFEYYEIMLLVNLIDYKIGKEILNNCRNMATFLKILCNTDVLFLKA